MCKSNEQAPPVSMLLRLFCRIQNYTEFGAQLNTREYFRFVVHCVSLSFLYAKLIALQKQSEL